MSKPKRDASRKSKVSGDTKGNNSGEQTQHGPPASAGARGSSMQGPRQAAKGGPAGANQGGAPRGSSRLEPSHARDPKGKGHKKTDE